MYATVEETALKWNISERSVRNYCAQNRVRGAVRDGEGWRIPADATKPARKGTGVLPVEDIKLKPIAHGNYSFAELIRQDAFYMDKTGLIGKWWRSPYKEAGILRPRGYGKSLMLSMIDNFFSISKANQGLFHKLSIGNDDEMMELRGTMPTVLVDFSGLHCNNAQSMLTNVKYLIRDVFRQHEEVLADAKLSEYERRYFLQIINAEDADYTMSIKMLCECLYKHYGMKPLLLIDGYDTPVIEAKRYGYWEEVGHFGHSLTMQTVRANQYYERMLMTGISRACKSVLGIELGDVKIFDVDSEEFAGYIGFTETEVQETLNLYGVGQLKEAAQEWYADRYLDNVGRLYNSYSIISLLDMKRLQPCWNNTAAVKGIGWLLRLSSIAIKTDLQKLLDGKSIKISEISSLDQNNYLGNRDVFWELLLDYGIVKRVNYKDRANELILTNKCVAKTLSMMVKEWLNTNGDSSFEMFVDAMLAGDVYSMNGFMGDIFSQKVASFATEPGDTKYATERFYHSLVLAMMLMLKDTHEVRTNPRSGYGRYDVMLVPKDKTQQAVLLEFKLYNPSLDSTMQDGLKAALMQLERQGYAKQLEAEGISRERIKKYGMVFREGEVLIGEAEETMT